MLNEIVNAIIHVGGLPFEVGGCVRDEFLEVENKDIDIEVFNLCVEELITVLEPFGSVNQVGISFGVVKLRLEDGSEFDFTLPRQDNKTGKGHKGFVVEVDHTMTIEEAATRRDYTINAISRDCRDGSLMDPYGGIQDLESRTLRHISDQFAEDPLRVLRGMQFCGRFGMEVDPETARLCASLSEEMSELALERVWAEWFKWASKSEYPSRGLEFLVQTDWIVHFPELDALRGVPQEPEWHPEGNVWEHTKHVCDAAARIAIREGLKAEERATLVFAALCHDLGKATTTDFLDGRWRAYGHPEEGVPLTRSFLERIGCLDRMIEVVEPLVLCHMAHVFIPDRFTERGARRLAVKLGQATIQQLAMVVESDMNGRPPLPGRIPENVQDLVILAEELKIIDEQPTPLIQGRHLISLGMEPGPHFGDLIQQCFEAQLDGLFGDEKQGVLYLEGLI